MPREGGAPSTPRLLDSITNWIARASAQSSTRRAMTGRRLHRRLLREFHVDLAQPVGHRAGLAVGDLLAVDRHHALHESGGAGDEGFLGGQRLFDRERALLDAELALLGERDHRLAGAARQN